jgi:metal-sulfur cluster biosynthetic enzyme
MSEEAAKTYSEDEISGIKDKIIGRLRTVYDPEIPVNLYDLGLIYKIEAYPAKEGDLIDLLIEMTLTAPGCPIADSIVQMVHDVLADMPEANEVSVRLVWEPPWDKSKMSDEARLSLNMDF